MLAIIGANAHGIGLFLCKQRGMVGIGARPRKAVFPQKCLRFSGHDIGGSHHLNILKFYIIIHMGMRNTAAADNCNFQFLIRHAFFSALFLSCFFLNLYPWH